jgi:hypothetical protein
LQQQSIIIAVARASGSYTATYEMKTRGKELLSSKFHTLSCGAGVQAWHAGRFGIDHLLGTISGECSLLSFDFKQAYATTTLVMKCIILMINAA